MYCQSLVFLCVFHYIASYCINTLFNSLHHILSTIYRCKTLSLNLIIDDRLLHDNYRWAC